MAVIQACYPNSDNVYLMFWGQFGWTEFKWVAWQVTSRYWLPRLKSQCLIWAYFQSQMPKDDLFWWYQLQPAFIIKTWWWNVGSI